MNMAAPRCARPDRRKTHDRVPWGGQDESKNSRLRCNIGGVASSRSRADIGSRPLLDTCSLLVEEEGRALGESGRYTRIRPVVQRVFDIPSMARLAVGASWPTLSAAQQEAVAAAFGAYISATYADRFDSYSGQRLQIIGQQPSGSGVVVKTHIVKANGEHISIDYLVRQSGGDWRISDVLLDGTVSQLATQRSEFGAILRRDGFDGLIAILQRKVNLLTGNVAKAS